MLKFVTGNFFDFDADIRINTVNCVGVMGAGAALQFKNKFPDMYKDYYQACSRNNVKIGNGHVWEQEDMFKSITIINFPTKKHWRNPSKYEYIEKGLEWLHNILIAKRDSSVVTLPALGCGHGGLDWNNVKELIVQYLNDLPCTILVFEPSSSTNFKESKKVAGLLDEKKIKKISPNDYGYPKNLKGRSAKDLYVKGNLALLDQYNISILVNPKPEEREQKALFSFIDELPDSNFLFLLGFSSSHEIDLVKIILERGYKTILILPYGILKLKIRKDLKHLLTPDNILIISATDPTNSWKSYESIKALKFRINLSNTTLISSYNYEKLNIVEKELNTTKTDKFYLNYWSENIDFFSRISARKIGINPRTNRINIEKLIESIKS